VVEGRVGGLGRDGRLSRSKAISDTRLRECVLRIGGIFLELVPQPADVDPQILRLVPILGAPHGADQLAMPEDNVRVSGQLLK
jgi:hypothetical protein